MGQLWSTVDDLARWATVLAKGADGVLAETTVEELWFPQVMQNPDDWTVGWGLGIMLVNHEGRIFGGHGGAMPGFLSGLYVNRETGTGAAVLTNAGSRAPTLEIALELADAALELWPPDVEPWRPEPAPPEEVAPLLGRWWSEGSEFVFRWKDEHLVAEVAGAPARVKPSVFEPVDGGYRVVSGREQGERLRVEGEQLVWGGYVFTRRQETTPSR
jgi:CubicO group peptidase (beta-lactamase class C family)